MSVFARLCALFGVMLCAASSGAATITANPGGGNWHSAATWSTFTIPTASDDVVLGASSGSVLITSKAAKCRSLDCTGYSATLTVSRMIQIGQAAGPPGPRLITLSPTMTLAGSAMILAGNPANGVKTILTCGKRLPSFTAYAIAQDDDLLTASLSTAYSYDTGGHDLTSESDIYVYLGTMTLGSSAVRCQIWDAHLASSVDAGTSTITIAGTWSRPAFVDGTRTYNRIVVDATLFAGIPVDGVTPAACTFGDVFTAPNLTLDSLSFVGPSGGAIAFRDGSVYALVGAAEWPSGTAAGLVEMRSTTAGAPWSVSSDAALVLSDYVSLQDSHASGSAAFVATNSSDAGGNVGWSFP